MWKKLLTYFSYKHDKGSTSYLRTRDDNSVDTMWISEKDHDHLVFGVKAAMNAKLTLTPEFKAQNHRQGYHVFIGENANAVSLFSILRGAGK